MVIAVRTEQGPDGLEIIKDAATDAGRDRLAREAEWLRRAAHPGVVDVVASEPGRLRLRHRGTPLARLVPLPPDHAAAVVRAVAETVADLHRQGIAHNRITAEHVVVGERGRPALCGFAEASDATDHARAGDVAALGAMLDHLLDEGVDQPWSPELRGARHARRRSRAVRGLRDAAAAACRDEPGQRPAAHHFATALLDALPEMRLPAPPAAPRAADAPGRFTDIPADFDPTDDLGWSDEDLSFLAIAEESDEDWITGQHVALDPTEAESPATPPTPVSAFEPPDEPEASTPEPDPTPARPRRDPPVITIRPAPARAPKSPAVDRRVLLAVAVVLVIVGTVAGVVMARAALPFGSGDPAEGAATTTSTATPVLMEPVSGEVRPTSQQAATTPTYPEPCAVPAVPGPDLDGDACPEPIALEERTATVGTVRVELGEPGDVVAVADSDCDGIATPVVLRPSTGEVFLFPRWSLREPLEVRAATVVAGGEHLAVDRGDCPDVAVTGDGVREVVTD